MMSRQPVPPFFLYGTLMDPGILSLVSGEAISQLRLRPAMVEGYRAFYVEGKNYPALVATPGARTEGRLLVGLGAEGAERVFQFEDAGYDPTQLTISLRDNRPRKALAFVASARMQWTDTVWLFEDWRRRHRADYFNRVRRWANSLEQPTQLK